MWSSTMRQVVLCSLWLLSACASPPKLDANLAGELDRPLYCEGEQQCREMWERAMFFVSNYAAYKIQIANDSLIQTYNPEQYSPRLAYKVSKEPLGGGRYQIWTNAYCANAFGCSPTWQEGVARAKTYIRSGQRDG